MVGKFLPRSRRAVVVTGVAGGLVLGGGGIATGSALFGSAQHSSRHPTPRAARHSRSARTSATATGLVTVVTGNSVTVQGKGGSRTFGLVGATTFREGKAKVSSSALRSGEKIRVRAMPGTVTDPVAQTVTIVPTSAAEPSNGP
ncbi:MAG TPA: hypothetical protein VFK66_09905 [Oryzihumus sp.]|nr:hypothetical protein [Oryzihumus sp.]